MQDRIQKEKEFHNSRFEKESRDSLSKYYSISFLIDRYYQDKLFSESNNKNILEYGCGLGRHSFELAKIAKHVYSIDISEVAIEKANEMAEEKGIKNISFQVMNAELLNYSDNSFDVVCGVAILHHLDLKAAYTELVRVLKPTAGKAIFIEPLGHNPFINLFRKFTPNLRTEDEHPLISDDLDLLKEYFNNVEIRHFYFSSLLSVPFKNTKFFRSIVGFLNKVDQILFKISYIKLLSWQVVIEISDPKKST